MINQIIKCKEIIADLKIILLCYDVKYRHDVLMNFLKYNCNSLSDSYKGYILYSIVK